MGASSWSYRVAYQPDVAVALEQLRQQVFVDGDYYRSDELSPQYALSEAEFVATLDPIQDESGINEYLLSDWREAQTDGRAAALAMRPTDPDSLLAAQPYSRTHSIIDMSNGVSEQPSTNAVAPLTSDQTASAFGTLTPAPDQVEEWLASPAAEMSRERSQGGYVLSYLDAQPAHIHFFGTSGD